MTPSMWTARARRLMFLGVAVVVAAGLSSPGPASAAAKPPVPSVVTFAASSGSVSFAGGSVRLTGAVQDATACTISVKPSIKGMLPSQDCAGFSTLVPVPANANAKAVSYTFTLTAKGPGGSVAATARVSVNAYPAPSVVGFSASPSTLAATGGTVTVLANVLYAQTCKVAIVPVIKGAPATMPCTGSVVVAVPANLSVTPITYTATVTARGIGGATTQTTSFTITVAPLQVSAGLGQTCARLPSGQVRCWGGDSNSMRPATVRGLGNVVNVSTGFA